MDNSIREKIRELIPMLEQVEDAVNDVLSDEQYAFEGTPEAFKEATQAKTSNNPIEYLASARLRIEDALEDLKVALEKSVQPRAF
jgi:hypothetical protein